jgi:hypothetical protein
MTDKVTALFGGTVSAVNEPIPELVAFVERLLARAKSGEIRAIAVTYVRGNGRPSEGWQRGDNPDHAFVLHSGIACLLGNFTDMLNATDTVAEAQPPPSA